MSIIDRIKLNLRANINYALSKAEDPKKVLDQLVFDLEESIRAFKESLVNAIANIKKMELEVEHASNKANLWANRALLALRRGDEDLAKQALAQKIAYIENEQTLKKELEEQRQIVNELKESLPKLEAKLELLRRKKFEFSADIPGTKSEPIDDKLIGRLGIDREVFDVYDAIVDKVKTAELYAEAMTELSARSELEVEFERMEKETLIESELKELKDKLS